MIQQAVQCGNDPDDGDDSTRLAPADCAEANCFYDPRLLEPALAYFDPDGSVQIIEAHGPGGVLTGRFPVIRSARHGRYPVRHVANWVYPHCYYGAPQLRTGFERDAWASMLAALDAANWSGNFLHLRLLDPSGEAARALVALCQQEGRPIAEIARYERALLSSDLSAEAYWTGTVRAKKRKELRRQQNRLRECGTISHAVLTDPRELTPWCDTFIALERSGWKGQGGTALGSRVGDDAFFREACANALAGDGLDMLRIDCDGRAIAMLVNFVGPKGGFSFKIAIDPEFARYSPGVLIEIDNLARVLDARRAPWMDSCAAPDHSMIDRLWAERRAIVQYRVALRKQGLGAIKARLVRHGIAACEALARRVKRLRAP